MNVPISRHRGMFRFIVAASFSALVLSSAGCYRATSEPRPEGAPHAATRASETPPSTSEGAGPSRPQPDRAGSSGGNSLPPHEISDPEPVPGELPEVSSPDSSPPAAGEMIPEREEYAAVPKPEGVETEGKSVPEEAATVAAVPPSPGLQQEGNGKARPGADPQKGPHDPPSRPDADPVTIVVARLSEDETFPRDGPHWARSREELVYRVEFLGITMGYARFTFLGKVLLSGREAYHLRVRAWTSDLLSVLYPVDDTIDYYLDTETIVPLRQENRKSRKEDDVAIYDQEKGRIVYRYRKDGKIRKKVDVVPNVYDPVSAAYYFRSRDIRVEEKARPMYAGRKLYEISAKPLGFERIRTDRGEFDTIVVQPVIRREGKIENKGDLRMWMTRDERHIPVRVYAKFRKVRTWTLVGELLPDLQGG